jgi:hypothetical protein
MNRLFTLISLLLAFSSFAQDEPKRSIVQDLCDIEALKSYNPIQGTVPLSYGHMPSTDLVCDSDECGPGIIKGDTLTPRDAAAYYHKRFQETRCQWTLADLDPAEDKGIWLNKLGGKLESDANKLPLFDMDSVDFVSEGWARLGSYRVTVNKNNQNGVPLQYTVILSKNVHNYLIRKALLKKLGYIVPPVKHVKRLKVKFPTRKAKKEFIKNLSVNNAGSFDRWILSESNKQVVLQDIVVMEDQEFRLNLAKGYVSADLFQGKRIYDSLIIPFSLTDVPESLNMFDWTVGRVYSENVVLKYPTSKEFSTSKDDAVWMVRRIMKLTKEDWEEIVDETALPPSVRLLLLQKLMNRRNHLGLLFKVQNINLEVDHVVSNHNDLEDGKITREFYDGFARRFKIPDPESPLAYSEMKSFFKSKAISTGMDLLVNAFNSSKFLGTDIAGKITDFHEKLAQNVATSVTSGGSTKTPVSSFIFPTISGNIILNREIVAGSYLGTDNLIQLVDTFGASISAGVFGGVTGVYSKTGDLVGDGAGGSMRQFVPIELTGNANIFLNRTYAHVKPITSVQKALKYPYKNMMIPLLKKKYGHYFDVLMNDDYDKVSDSDKRKMNATSYKHLSLKSNEMKEVYSTILSDVKDENVMNAIADLSKLVEDSKNVYENTIIATKSQRVKSNGKIVTVSTSIAKDILAKAQLIKTSIDKAYVTYDGCRKESIKKINKYFSIVEKEIKAKDAYGKEIVESVEQIICASNRKGKIEKTLNSAILALEEIKRTASIHSYRLDEKEREHDLEKISGMLNENLEVGESLIITDTVGGSLSLGAGVSLYNVAKVKLNARPNKMLVSRLHIHRSSETEIHVYKDLGNLNGIEFAMSVEQFVPILKITFKATKGKARTRFYKVNIGAIEDKYEGSPNVHRIDNLKALRSVFLTGSVEALDNVKKPYTIVHNFKENNSKFGITVFRWNWLRTSDDITVTSPEGYEKKMYRRVKGNTKGTDFENYTKDLVDLLVGKLAKTNYSISSFNKGNPGFTFMGKAKNKITTYEGLLNSDGKIEKPYAKLSRIWNGWKMKKKKAIKILREIKKKYGFDFFEEEVLSQTKELFLYNINVNFYVYDTGLGHMLSIPTKKLKTIWTNNQARGSLTFSGKDILVNSGYYRFLKFRKKYSKYLLENNQKELSKVVIKLVEIVEDKLKMSGISQVFGGGNNVFAIAKIDGFRVGDENGDKKIMSNSFGRIGTENIDGPISRLKRFMGITTGEFNASWLLGRVI